MRRTKRWLPALAMSSLLLAPLGAARAQAPGTVPEGGAAAPGEESKGDPLYGYVGTAFLAGLALFVVGKSARR